jgi:hypothetical protein
MHNQIFDGHPKQRLIFFVAQDIDDSIRQSTENMVNQLATARKWVIGAPRFIDIVEDLRTRDEDSLDETLGGEHEIYSALGQNILPYEVDVLHFEEVEEIVRAVQIFSKTRNLAFEFELDGKFVGSIEDGKIDSTLAVGLLGEWRRHLNTAS